MRLALVCKLSKVVGAFARFGGQIDELSKRGGNREEKQKKGQSVMSLLIVSLRAQGHAIEESLRWMNPKRFRGVC